MRGREREGREAKCEKMEREKECEKDWKKKKKVGERQTLKNKRRQIEMEAYSLCIVRETDSIS